MNSSKVASAGLILLADKPGIYLLKLPERDFDLEVYFADLGQNLSVLAGDVREIKVHIPTNKTLIYIDKMLAAKLEYVGRIVPVTIPKFQFGHVDGQAYGVINGAFSGNLKSFGLTSIPVNALMEIGSANRWLKITFKDLTYVLEGFASIHLDDANEVFTISAYRGYTSTRIVDGSTTHKSKPKS